VIFGQGLWICNIQGSISEFVFQQGILKRIGINARTTDYIDKKAVGFILLNCSRPNIQRVPGESNKNNNTACLSD